MESASTTQIVILIAVACLTMVCLFLGMIAFVNVHRKRMLEKEAKIQLIEKEKQVEIFRAAIEAEELQKEKIARNLHDQVVASLSEISRSMNKNQVDFNNNLFDINRYDKDLNAIRQITKDVRGISYDLVPAALVSFGLVKAIDYYIKELTPVENASISFENKIGPEHELPFSLSEQQNIYRILLELLNNLQKHAGYNFLNVMVDKNEKHLEIDLMHDGKAVSNEEMEINTNLSKGIGLKSLKSRSLLLNAGINYLIEDGLGRINIVIPFKL